MKRDTRFYFAKDLPDWSIRINNIHIIGIGNPLRDKFYFKVLSEYLLLYEGLYFEEVMEEPQYICAKPVMTLSQGDIVSLLKPGRSALQDTIGILLHQLKVIVEMGNIEGLIT